MRALLISTVDRQSERRSGLPRFACAPAISNRLQRGYLLVKVACLVEPTTNPRWWLHQGQRLAPRRNSSGWTRLGAKTPARADVLSALASAVARRERLGCAWATLGRAANVNRMAGPRTRGLAVSASTAFRITPSPFTG